jgi:hypothetical protein
VKIPDYRATFYEFTGKASDLNRQLGFAAIALIWLFKKDAGGALTLPSELILPGILVVSSLTLDMVQYCVAAIVWRFYYRSKEKAGISDDTELGLHDERLELPIWFFFVAKIVCIVAAYAFIFRFLVKVLLNHGS